jgi:hypothetical protein
VKSKVIEFKPKQKKSNRKKSVPRAETFAPPSGGTEKTALNQPPRHLAWQAHGNFRSPHGPAALHISRKRSG